MHLGITICYKCGKIYWLTQEEDGYKISEKEDEGRVCEPCLLKPITGRDKVDEIFHTIDAPYSN